ncbi:Enoyl-(Acyl carrier protein) reductase [Faunimonas pinastri]|uniref:Enoyl-(Acyl carrier protein) reductase n=1 Tax=Faunimonas pinastri TaxID=1855383 RepID=A0A1H9Q2C2_9HYPH|nr:SDR family oxidoreductase [Faunimonas pinastri]SER54109.1 Enoyl-(Acyl carrier protein) reductase [Faunimonas pinastri]
MTETVNGNKPFAGRTVSVTGAASGQRRIAPKAYVEARAHVVVADFTGRTAGRVAESIDDAAFSAKVSRETPLMVERGGGSIINNASFNALSRVSGADGRAATKGGIGPLTRVPGDTPMKSALMTEPGCLHAMTSAIPLGRAAWAGEVAHVAVSLTSERPSYLNGVILPVDGGWEEKSA